MILCRVMRMGVVLRVGGDAVCARVIVCEAAERSDVLVCVCVCVCSTRGCSYVGLVSGCVRVFRGCGCACGQLCNLWVGAYEEV